MDGHRWIKYCCKCCRTLGLFSLCDTTPALQCHVKTQNYALPANVISCCSSFTSYCWAVNGIHAEGAFHHVQSALSILESANRRWCNTPQPEQRLVWYYGMSTFCIQLLLLPRIVDSMGLDNICIRYHNFCIHIDAHWLMPHFEQLLQVSNLAKTRCIIMFYCELPTQGDPSTHHPDRPQNWSVMRDDVIVWYK